MYDDMKKELESIKEELTRVCKVILMLQMSFLGAIIIIIIAIIAIVNWIKV